ncbi:phosphoglucosamine mutase [Gammaproteobacteria bacterium]|nr:phosphoglucosamine mutase [Gammaproteobacteria bacterium]
MSNVVFGTDGIRGLAGGPVMNAENALKFGWALGEVLKGKNAHPRVLIGKDTRISGYMFESALEAGLCSSGCEISLLGPMPTPAIGYLTQALRADAGIVISASHNPYQDNGIKVFNHCGAKFDRSVEVAIAHLCQMPMKTVDPTQLGKATRIREASGRYIEFCKSKIRSDISLKGISIVLDCAHGATYHIAPHVFQELGARVTVIGNKPNGLNINDDCGSTHVEKLVKKVLATKSDLGFAFDGDGDRLIVVDHQGKVYDGDDLLYLMSGYLQQTDQLHGGIIGTVMTNAGLVNWLDSQNIPFKRANVGDRSVMAKLKQYHWRIGGEPSGHFVNLDRTLSGDGIVGALMVLEALIVQDKSLAEVISSDYKFPSKMVNIPKDEQNTTWINQDAFVEDIKKVEKSLGRHGRILIRESGTESCIRVLVETDQVKQLNPTMHEVVEKLKNRLGQAVS